MNAAQQDVDRDAREFWNRCAIAAGMSDTALALECCRQAGEIERAYELRLRDGEQHTRANGAPFVGLPILARFASRCAVCSEGIAEGSSILYAPDLKKAAHATCGEPAL